MIQPEISDILVNQVLKKDSLVLDVGGGRHPWFRADYILDRRDFEEQVGATAHGNEDEEKPRFTKDTWIDRDFYDQPWPFEDKMFDFVVCLDTLEDIRDPFSVIKEMQRVAKAGYITTPTRAAESNIGGSKHPDAAQLYGYVHHRWNVEVSGDDLVFKHKTPLLYQHPQYSVQRVLQKTLNFFWKDSFDYREEYLFGQDGAMEDLVDFHKRHTEWLEKFEKSGEFDSKMYNHWVKEWGEEPDFESMKKIIVVEY